MNTTQNVAESEMLIKFPFVVTRANVSVPIYRVKSANKGGFCYKLPDYTKEVDKNGKPVRTLRSFANFNEAKSEAVKIATLQSKGETSALKMTGAQASEYGNAVQMLAPFKITLGEAVLRCIEAIKILGGNLDKMPEAARFYVARHPAEMPSKTVAELIVEMLAVKRARKMAASYIDDLESRFTRFSEEFGSVKLADVSTNTIQKWLDRLGLSAQSYMNYRRVLFGLFAFAETRGYIAKGTNPFELAERLKTGDGEVEIFSVKEFKAMLAVCLDDYLPCLAIGGFAGLRSAEIQRLEWCDVDLRGRVITVAASKAKTASRRTVPICAALAAWLEKFTGKTGYIWLRKETGEADEDGFVNAQRRVAKEAGIKWKGNALRHSYASYRLSEIEDATRTAYELGNSPAMVHRHYKALVRPEEAKAWFSIFPSQLCGESPVPERSL